MLPLGREVGREVPGAGHGQRHATGARAPSTLGIGGDAAVMALIKLAMSVNTAAVTTSRTSSRKALTAGQSADDRR